MGLERGLNVVSTAIGLTYHQKGRRTTGTALLPRKTPRGQRGCHRHGGQLVSWAWLTSTPGPPLRRACSSIVYWFTKRRLGRVPAPVGIMAHNRAVLAASAAFELAFERAHALDPRLELLASVKVASLVGCRFCIDIGSALAHAQGIAEAALLDLPVYDTSQRFSGLKKRVLDYAVAMTGTPLVVPRALFEELRAALGVSAWSSSRQPSPGRITERASITLSVRRKRATRARSSACCRRTDSRL